MTMTAPAKPYRPGYRQRQLISVRMPAELMDTIRAIMERDGLEYLTDVVETALSNWINERENPPNEHNHD